MKKILFSLLLLLSTVVYAQSESPIKINASVDTEGAELTLKFVAEIEPGWHLYSTGLADGGPTSATVTFETLEGAEVVGALTPGAGEIEIDDPIFEMKVKYFENSATLTQKLKLLGGDYRLQGYLRYGACNDENCLPPTTYEFDIKGAYERQDCGNRGGCCR